MKLNKVAKISEIDGAGMVALVVLLGLFYFAAMKPLSDRQNLEAAQQKELGVQQGKAEVISIAVQSATEHLASVRQAIAQSPLKLEPVRALNDRLAKITTLATAERLDIADVRPGAVAVGDHYTTIPIAINGTGRFQNCVHFIHSMQDHFSDMTVTELKLSGSPENSGGNAAAGKVVFEFGLRWYAAPEHGNQK